MVELQRVNVSRSLSEETVAATLARRVQQGRNEQDRGPTYFRVSLSFSSCRDASRTSLRMAVTDARLSLATLRDVVTTLMEARDDDVTRASQDVILREYTSTSMSAKQKKIQIF